MTEIIHESLNLVHSPSDLIPGKLYKLNYLKGNSWPSPVFILDNENKSKIIGAVTQIDAFIFLECKFLELGNWEEDDYLCDGVRLLSWKIKTYKLYKILFQDKICYLEIGPRFFNFFQFEESSSLQLE